jgi:hypothetical protein
MIITSKSDEIVDFLDFFRRIVGDEAPRERMGAALSDIARFASLTELPLPPLYLGYLREFGASDGVLRMADDADPRVETLIEYYLDQQGKAEPEIPKRGVVIGTYGIAGERTLLYPEEAVEPAVVVSWWGDVANVIAETFRNHLYRQAFCAGRMRKGALFVVHKNDEHLIPDAVNVAVELEFSPYWFADDWQVCLEGANEASLYVERIPNRTAVYGGFRDERSRDRVKAILIERLGMLDSGSWVA